MIFTHKQTKIADFSLDKIYKIIADVPSYKDFIKWIKDIQEIPVLNSQDNKDYNYIKDFKITVGFGFIEESFTTRDYFITNNSIKVELISGAFKTLNSLWEFKSLSPNQTEITFSMDFSFKSAIIEKMFSKVFLIANEKITDAFIERAKEVYKN